MGGFDQLSFLEGEADERRGSGRSGPEDLAAARTAFRPELDEHLLRSACPAGVCHPVGVTPAGSAT